MPGIQKTLKNAKNPIFKKSPVHISYGYMDKDYGGPHKGADLLAGCAGTEDDVVAIEDGVVEYLKTSVNRTLPLNSAGFTSADALGNNVIIKHSDKVKSRYCHLKYGSIIVKSGQDVKKGQKIGIIGNTGCSSGIHVHFEIHVAGNRIDPEPFLLGNASFKTGKLEAQKPIPGCVLYSTTDTVNIREKPSLSGKKIDLFPSGTIVNVYEDIREYADGYTWIRISYEGNYCWAVSNYLKRI